MCVKKVIRSYLVEKGLNVKRLFFLVLMIILTTSVVSPKNSNNQWGYQQKYYKFAQKNNVSTGILVNTYNRPQYLQQLIASLEKNPESQTLPFFFVLDGGPNATQKENFELITKSKIKNKEIVARKTNYGCGRSIIDARRFMFEWCDFEKIILFEDDFVASPEYI